MMKLAYEEGVHARLSGRPYLLCPYTAREDRFRRAWQSGWMNEDYVLRTHDATKQFA